MKNRNPGAGYPASSLYHRKKNLQKRWRMRLRASGMAGRLRILSSMFKAARRPKMRILCKDWNAYYKEFREDNFSCLGR